MCFLSLWVCDGFQLGRVCVCLFPPLILVQYILHLKESGRVVALQPRNCSVARETGNKNRTSRFAVRGWSRNHIMSRSFHGIILEPSTDLLLLPEQRWPIVQEREREGITCYKCWSLFLSHIPLCKLRASPHQHITQAQVWQWDKVIASKRSLWRPAAWKTETGQLDQPRYF